MQLTPFHCFLQSKDIIRIKLGDVAPADLKMLNGENVKADQSALTGESLPVGKEVGEEIFSGSVLKMGVCFLSLPNIYY